MQILHSALAQSWERSQKTTKVKLCKNLIFEELSVCSQISRNLNEFNKVKISSIINLLNSICQLVSHSKGKKWLQGE